MNYIDIILGILLILAAIGGFKNGLVTELASLTALIFGIWGAIQFSYITTDLLIKYFNLQTDYLNIISFAVTFVVIVILVHVVAGVINKMVNTGVLGVTNKLAGMVFGVLRSILFLSIILLIFDKIDEDVEILPKDVKAKSRMYEPIKNVATSIFPFIDNWRENQELFRDKDSKVV